MYRCPTGLSVVNEFVPPSRQGVFLEIPKSADTEPIKKAKTRRQNNNQAPILAMYDFEQ
jgi:hypothetical protein